MVRAELVYNPYLLETEVRFNGNPPRINSLVEKYQGKKLQTWVSKIPAIFYDEMNGYDFQLDFSGTDLDFEELKKSFDQAGVGKDKVILFHKDELDGRHEKTVAIDRLLEWLKENPNRKFDFDQFHGKNKEVFEKEYPFIIIGEPVSIDSIFENMEIEVDNVDSVDELRRTDLTSTPILMCLNRKNMRSLQYNLVKLLNRSDVSQDQLFFIISPALGTKAERVLRDLGVKDPQVVTSVKDSRIYRYLEVYPVSEYIHDAIRAFREQTDDLKMILDEESRRSEITNQDIHERINGLDDILIRLKTADEYFLNLDNLGMPKELTDAKTNLLESIKHWKIKKTKITKIDEALKLSVEFQTELNQWYEDFREMTGRVNTIVCSAIMNRCSEWYKNAAYKEDFQPDDIGPDIIPDCSLPGIVEDLMKLKEEQYVMPKEDFFGKFFKGGQDNTPQEPVLETSYYYEKWREHAIEVVEPIADDLIQKTQFSLQKYYKDLSNLYDKQIKTLIAEVTSERDQVSSQLSKEERLLQNDIDWHTSFCDQLHDIERA